MISKPRFAANLLIAIALLGCKSASARHRRQTHLPDKPATYVFFKTRKLHVSSYLQIDESAGSEKVQKELVVAGDGWIKYENGPRIESVGTNIFFNHHLIETTSINMVVGPTNFTMGAFIRDFE